MGTPQPSSDGNRALDVACALLTGWSWRPYTSPRGDAQILWRDDWGEPPTDDDFDWLSADRSRMIPWYIPRYSDDLGAAQDLLDLFTSHGWTWHIDIAPLGVTVVLSRTTSAGRLLGITCQYYRPARAIAEAATSTIVRVEGLDP